MRPIALVGANGQLGSDLATELRSSSARPLIELTRSVADIRDHRRVAEVLEAVNPEVVINTAAFHKVEACEASPDDAFAVNATAVRNLAFVANKLKARLVHISTDYVFDGETSTGYSEDAAPNPVNVYGTSKVAGESFLRNLSEDYLLVRTSGLYGVAGSSGKGGNFVQTMLRLGRERDTVSVVADQTLSPTYTSDLAKAIRELVEHGAHGLFHVTNTEACSWYEFASAIFDLSGVSVECVPITTASQGASVRRPRYSVLKNTRLEGAGLSLLRPWRSALASYLETIGVRTESAAHREASI